MLPPLRDRRSDIAALAGHFVEAGRHAGLPDRQFAPAAMQRLERHDWPGNVRELGNVVQRLAVLSRDTVVTARDVEAVVGDGDDGASLAKPVDLIARAVDDWAHEQLMRGDGDLHARLQEIVEAALLRRTLREVRDNQLEAVRRPVINRNMLRHRLGQLALDPAQPSRAEERAGPGPKSAHLPDCHILFDFHVPAWSYTSKIGRVLVHTQ